MVIIRLYQTRASGPSLHLTMSTPLGPAICKPDARELTAEESTGLRGFQKTLETNELAFTAGDMISSHHFTLRKHCFYYTSGDTLHRVPLPFTAETAQQVYDDSRQAPFGKGSKKVIDESYRRARELHVSWRESHSE